MFKGWINARARREQAGFTLVEILVVVAVIAVLAALMFPALKGSLERARTASCMQNLRSLGVAFTLYAADHNGWMPTGAIQQSSLAPDLLNYMGAKSKQRARSAWICPADRMIEERAKLIGFSSNPNEQFFYSYGFIEAFLPSCATDPTCSSMYILTNQFPIVSSVVQHPGKAVFLSDGGWFRIVNNSLTFRHQRVQFRHGRPAELDGMETDQRQGYWSTLGYDTRGGFKSAVANLFFYDGHVEGRTYATYAGLLNSFISAGYSDRSGLTLIPSSEF